MHPHHHTRFPKRFPDCFRFYFHSPYFSFVWAPWAKRHVQNNGPRVSPAFTHFTMTYRCSSRTPDSCVERVRFRVAQGGPTASGLLSCSTRNVSRQMHGSPMWDCRSVGGFLINLCGPCSSTTWQRSRGKQRSPSVRTRAQLSPDLRPDFSALRVHAFNSFEWPRIVSEAGDEFVSAENVFRRQNR